MSLPELSASEMFHARQMRDILMAKIRASGAMPFSQFMAFALYEPRWGYYRSLASPFGEKGDFVTSPEISSEFSACLGRQSREFFLVSTGAIF